MSPPRVYTPEELWPVALHEAAHFVVAQIVLERTHGWSVDDPWVSRGPAGGGLYGYSGWTPPPPRTGPTPEELPDLACALAAGGAADTFWMHPAGDHGDVRNARDHGITPEVWRTARQRADEIVRACCADIEAIARRIHASACPEA